MNEDHCLSHWLDGYIDGGLEAEDRRAVEVHLEGCPDCRADVEFLNDLRAQAHALPVEVAPSRSLWPAIASRIAPPAADAAPTPVIPLRPRRIAVPPSWRGLAAAAVVLVVLSSAATAYLLRLGPERGAAPLAAVGDQPPPHVVGLAAFEPAEAEYRYTVSMLEAELAARRTELLPETVQAVENSLAIIDVAIAEARQALAADPTSADLPLLLSGVYRRKVELLQQAVLLPARS